ncbi:MAG: hypothetical protein NZO58_09305 [Gemmataceae bacterium]|nr:hypothetical protein [Gemmataceae bacterium]
MTTPRELLESYLDDALGESETARLEQELRRDEELRRRLLAVMGERDRGEHTVGAIWRRHRLSCPSREQLGSFLLNVLDAGLRDYVDFHLRTIACAYCLANLADLQAQQQADAAVIQQRQQRVFQSSAGLLRKR